MAVPWLMAQAPPPGPGVVLEIVVNGVRSARGDVLAAVCTQADFLRDHCARNGRARATPGSTVVRVADVPPGIYAVQVWHDEDGNGKITRNFLGIPQEGVGFSRDAPFRFGPPRFADAAFQLGPQGGRVVVNLRFFD